MPTFLEDFAQLVDSKRDELKNKILKGKPNWLERDFRKYLSAHWVFLESLNAFSTNPGEFDVLAVDSSVYTNLLSNGGVFYIIRSLAVQRDVVGKRLESDVIFSRDRMSRIRELITAKMEMLEFEVALESLKNGFNGDAVLLDGSLYGRVSHVPIESKVEEERDVLLRYFKVYKELLDVCNKSGVLLVGISKESRSTFYRDYLLSLIFDEKLGELDVEEEDKKRLREIFFQVLDVERVAFAKFFKLKGEYGDELEVMESILRELASSRPDYQLIINYVSSVGYMRPLLLGPSVRMARRFKEYHVNPKECVKKYFPRLSIEKGEDFIRWASDILRSIIEFPSFVSFYILLDPRDSPIRVDMPHYGRSLFEVGWPEPVEVDISKLLKIMATGYCGLNAYNLWLKNADEKVRLRRKVVDDIYFSYLEKLFGDKIIRGRSYRRVKYP
ncbi:DNA double-strand break repair nuclease NurA [Candidatus Bathyarchaeota archaeon]|nr:DNA double-strand break repair nuclease NurA [Candidatus Bathyarchaeota archaeon]